ncbi:MAG: ribonuclease E/G family protein [Gammaproteobacteria bacterium]|nr:ribonuclease E/G family protein [Gammaproteobacteria bacterium]
MKRILINRSFSDELRVALVDGAKLFDLENESDAQSILKGSIFKAKVSRVETSLDAAFVNFGSERHGFLPLKELSSQNFTSNPDGNKKCNLKENDEILVQVVKEERSTKGAALTNQISLAGRFVVLIPNSEKSGGVSRRISGDERSEIKNIINKLNIPKEMSLIVRTAGLGRSIEELKWDVDYLMNLWNQIQETAPNALSPSLIYKDDKLILRVFRDYFRDNIGEILIDDKDVYNEAIEFATSVIPNHVDKVIFYDEDIPLFNRYQIENQIELAFKREISLPSGGSIVIDPTEAMVSIDVNSARSTKGKDIESTAFATNMEAAKEIARQLRLRDLGGLIVIDFIDMHDEKHQQKVENAFRSAVQSDRARVQIASISRFGLLEISRQRLKPSLDETYDIEHIQIRGTRSLGQSIMRIISEDAAKENTGEIHVYVPTDVSSYLLNEKRRDIINIENTYEVNIIIIADPYKSRPYYKVARVKAHADKKIFSHNMTPNSPEPSLEWKDSNNAQKNLTPLVKVSVPPKKPKRNKSIGIFNFIKSIFSVSKKKNISTKKNKRNKYKKSSTKKYQKNFIDKSKDTKKSQNNKLKNLKNHKPSKPSSKPINKSNNKKPKSSNKEKINNKFNKNKSKSESSVLRNQEPKIESSISKEPKSSSISTSVPKPTRALNDPRYKNE